ncbi:NADH-quinone oxidoreductase subunit NuoF [Lacimicrobium alkaliphilum]|uniref:NADH-quinone oxidoreductase subunit F n=1 Tax=Lacimicrobium alkaliphilum TaxID=1526571 RepID=A0ABQ1R995_9ALTE|nr:NADH-quinone oxidoreductase subunit NuoF [Lacimicrobium alkaliphilum]GGD60526.1 NADH-quinone oxidoreductase subunit F [Lacimicrobium alkaliphilum]
MDKPLTATLNIEQPLDLDQYRNKGGYQGFARALDLTPEEVQQQVKEANLRGRGGAGFPTGMKWGFVPMGEDSPGRKYLVCNADEMEPGTFKDRWLMEGAPHLLVEGMMIAAYAISASVAYLFLRGEYRLCATRLEKAIREAEQAGLLGENIQGSGYSLNLHLHTSAGRYICGEETALLNALEGKRAHPRAKPPFPQVVGLFGQPTVVNNAETLCNIPGILRQGPAWYQDLGRGEDAGTKIYGISGRVKNPGLWELPMGAPAKEIFDLAGGMQHGLKLRGWLPGGASTDFLLPEHLDTPMEYDAIAEAGSRLGTGGIIALDDKHCPVGMVLNLIRFFAQESCGWCTPCRDGLPWASEILNRIESGRGSQEDLDELQRLCDFMWMGKTFCALAPGAVEPMSSAMKYFADDFQQHIDKGCCPYRH